MNAEVIKLIKTNTVAKILGIIIVSVVVSIVINSVISQLEVEPPAEVIQPKQEETNRFSDTTSDELIAAILEKDTDGNLIDDTLDEKIRTRGAEEGIEITIRLNRPYEESDLEAFETIGGTVTGRFHSLFYGFAGTIQLGKIEILKNKFSDSLELIEDASAIVGINPPSITPIEVSE